MPLTKQEQEDLQRALTVAELSRHKGWVEWLKPLLVSRRDQAFPDPQSFDSDRKFYHAAVVSSALKKATAEILMAVEDMAQVAETLQKKERGEVENKFAIGK